MNMYKLVLSLMTVVYIHCQANITQESKQITESIQIHWVDASNLAKVMTAIAKNPNSDEIVPLIFNADTQTNSITIIGDCDWVIKAKQVILELDLPVPIVHIEVLTGEAQEQARLEAIAYLESLLELYKQPTSN